MEEKSKILILGGTEFVGRQLVSELLAEGTYELYLSNRGKTNPDLFSQAFPVWFGRDLKISNGKLLADFPMDFVSFEASVRSTIEHYEKQGWRPGKVGIGNAEEDELLKKW